MLVNGLSLLKLRRRQVRDKLPSPSPEIPAWVLAGRTYLHCKYTSACEIHGLWRHRFPQSFHHLMPTVRIPSSLCKPCLGRFLTPLCLTPKIWWSLSVHNRQHLCVLGEHHMAGLPLKLRAPPFLLNKSYISGKKRYCETPEYLATAKNVNFLKHNYRETQLHKLWEITWGLKPSSRQTNFKILFFWNRKGSRFVAIARNSSQKTEDSLSLHHLFLALKRRWERASQIHRSEGCWMLLQNNPVSWAAQGIWSLSGTTKTCLPFLKVVATALTWMATEQLLVNSESQSENNSS